MNSKERILAAIRLEEPDRVPCSPHFSAGIARRMPDEEWQALQKWTDVTMTVKSLGDEQIFGGQYWLDHTSTSREGDTVTTVTETPKGLLTSRNVLAEQTSWVVEYICKEPEDTDELFSVPYTIPEFKMDNYFEWEERLGDDGLVSLSIPSAFRLCLDIFGPENLYLTIADDPDLIEKLVATMNERLAYYVEACCKMGVRSFWMGGTEHCGPGVVNPKLFKRLVTPYDKRIVDIVHDYDGIVNLHTHGKLKDVLDDIAEIGVDVMSPIETGLRGDVTLAEAKARIGDRVCLKGNLDDMAFLALAPAEEVRRLAEDAISQAAAGGGYILSGTDAGIYSSEWVQNFLVMAEVARGAEYV